MRSNIKRWIRWLAIGGCAAYGIYGLVEGLWDLSQQREAHWAFRWMILAPLLVVVSSVFLMVSYFVFRLQYRRLCTLIAIVAAVAAFGCIISIPELVGIAQWADPRAHGALSVVGGLVSMVVLVAAWYGARWVYRVAYGFLLRYVQSKSHNAALR
jgi:hypothetical protein